MTLTCIAFSTAQFYLTQQGAQLAPRGIRRLLRWYDPQLGHSPEIIYIGHYYAVFTLEELLRLLRRPTH